MLKLRECEIKNALKISKLQINSTELTYLKNKIPSKLNDLFLGNERKIKYLGKRDIKLTLLDPMVPKEYFVNIKALNITQEIYKLIKEYIFLYNIIKEKSFAENTDEHFNYDYSFIEMNNHNCIPYEMKNEFFIKGNKFKSSCDMFGTSCGLEIETVYAFYLINENKPIFIRETYLNL